ncbi:response regulator transcription factor [Roseimarinus sediminis]|uniref:response regulator transcription factor n=1 Tax=Roseimarinus sediminis TaxID=1610899 RepID=UPI003D253B2B
MIKKIFFVEDDLSFGSVMKSYLELSDYQVDWVDDGQNAVKEFERGVYDLVLLDVMLPHVDGFTIGKKIKELKPDLPLIYLTAKSLKEDILKGYGLGADDYITKPFDSEVLLCKIEAVMKRRAGEPETVAKESFQIGSYHFNFRRRQVIRNAQVQQLSPREAELLRMLCLNINELLAREEALKKIWGDDDYFTARSMDVYVTKLRKYLKDDPDVGIKNIHGSGFILEVNQ